MGKRLELVGGRGAAPDQDIVAACKELLRLAEAGELRAVAVAVDYADGACGHSLAFADKVNLGSVYLAVGQIRRRIEDLSRDNTEDA